MIETSESNRVYCPDREEYVNLGKCEVCKANPETFDKWARCQETLRILHTEPSPSETLPTETLRQRPPVDTPQPKPTPEPLSPKEWAPFNYLPIDKIDPPSIKARLIIDESKVNELIASMQKYGILVPLLVRPKPPGRYEIVCGHRRFLGAKKVGISILPCVIRVLTDCEVHEAQVIENDQREDFTDYERAVKYDAMLKESPQEYPNHEALALKVGKSRSWVSQRLRMLKLTNIIPQGIMLNLHESHARAILSIPTQEQREKVVAYINEYIERLDSTPSPWEITSFAQAQEDYRNREMSELANLQGDGDVHEPQKPRKIYEDEKSGRKYKKTTGAAGLVGCRNCGRVGRGHCGYCRSTKLDHVIPLKE